ncbi:hypothetical protein EWW49_28350 [Pseudomonas syringae]|nr:hypothetical protein EWW49_28350 [Pseudomonas syringae]
MQSLFEAFVTLLMTEALLAGCNHEGLAYRNLVGVIPWTLSDYPGRNSEQKGCLDVSSTQNLS